MATKEKMMERVQSAKSFNPGGTRTAAGQGTPRTVQRGSGPVSPDYQKSKYAQRDAGLTGRSSAPSFSAPGFKGKARKARIHSQRVQYERERRLAADKTGLEGMRQTGQTQRVGMQQAGAGQRQRAGFVQALQQQQARFGQQSAMQQNLFGQQNQQQQARFGQESAMQERRFGQQNQLEQTKQEGQRRQSALDYRAAGGSIAGAATINNGGYTDYGNIQPLGTQNTTGTYRTVDLGPDPNNTLVDRQGVFDTRTGRTELLTLGERLGQ